MKYIFKVISLVLIVIFTKGCNNISINDNYVMQINKAGIRKGIFERRFRLSNMFGKTSEFQTDSLKSFINSTLLPEYLFIEKSYDLNFDKDAQIMNNVLELKMNLLASNNPIYKKEIFISDELLKDFYNKKAFLYDFDIIQNSSFYSADSIQKLLKSGKSIKKESESKTIFPRFLTYTEKSFGESVPKTIFETIEKMNLGEISEPIYTPPIWTVIKLNNKTKNTKLEAFDNYKKNLFKEIENYTKADQIRKYIDGLKEKYLLEIVNLDYDKLFNSFVITEDKHGYFDRNKYKGLPSDITFIKTNAENLTLDQFFFIYNRSNQFSQISKLYKIDFDAFLNDLVDQFLLYLDAKEAGIQNEETIADQIENKLNRTLLTKFLKEQISDKIILTDDEIRNYYEQNKSRWPGEFDNVKSSIISEIRNIRIKEYSNSLIENLKSEYTVNYNEKLLDEFVNKFSLEKMNKQN